MMLNQHVMVSTWSLARWYLMMVSTRQTQQNKKLGFFDKQFRCGFLWTKKIHEEYQYLLDPKMLTTESMGFWLAEKVWPFATCKNNISKQRLQTCLATYQTNHHFSGKKTAGCSGCSDVSIFVFKLLFSSFTAKASSIFVFVDGGIGARWHKLSSCHNPISACMASVARELPTRFLEAKQSLFNLHFISQQLGPAYTLLTVESEYS